MKQDTKHYKLAIDIVTLSNMSISAAEEGMYDPDTQWITRYKLNNGGVSCTLAATETTMDPRSQKPKDKGSEGGDTDKRTATLTYPVIPPSTQTGLIRRHAAFMMGEAATVRGEYVKPETFSALMCGTNKSSESSWLSVEGRREARLDPFFGVFGGTSNMLHSGIVVHPGLPLIKATETMLDTKVLDTDLVRDTDRLDEMMAAKMIVRKNDLQNSGKMELIEKIVGLETLIDYNEAMSVQLEASKANKEAQKQARKEAAEKGERFVEDKAKKVDLRAFNFVEVVRPRMGFGLRYGVTAYTPAHLGLFLLALQRFMIEGTVGGRVAKGCGRFRATRTMMYEVDKSTGQKKALGDLFNLDKDGFEFAPREAVDNALAAAKDYLEKFELAKLNGFCNRVDVPAKRKGKADKAEA